MRKTRQIAIILSDTLQSIGLQSLLTDYFPPVEVRWFSSFETFNMAGGSDTFDFYFTTPEVMVINSDFFLPRRIKTVVLVYGENCEACSSTNHLSIRASEEVVIEQLQQILATDSSAGLSGDTNKDLSMRETDVLQLIVKGITNKEIADKLNISLNTVLTHRKNITSKLGIKTVSGLTFYAIMNGIISGDEIEL